MTVIVEARRLQKAYGEIRAVEDVSFSIETGEIFGLLGPNGAGKTTTLRMISTVLRPTEGKALVCDLDVAERPTDVRRKIGFLSGNTAVYERMTAREMVEYFGRLYGMDESAINKRGVHGRYKIQRYQRHRGL